MLCTIGRSRLLKVFSLATVAALINLLIASCGGEPSQGEPGPVGITMTDHDGKVLYSERASWERLLGGFKEGRIELIADGQATTDLSAVLIAKRSELALNDGSRLVLASDGKEISVVAGPEKTRTLRITLEGDSMTVTGAGGAWVTAEVQGSQDDRTRDRFFAALAVLLLSGETGLAGVEVGRCAGLCVLGIVVAVAVAVVLITVVVVDGVKYIVCDSGQAECHGMAKQYCSDSGGVKEAKKICKSTAGAIFGFKTEELKLDWDFKVDMGSDSKCMIECVGGSGSSSSKPLTEEKSPPPPKTCAELGGYCEWKSYCGWPLGKTSDCGDQKTCCLNVSLPY